jgi:hypothetical protein
MIRDFVGLGLKSSRLISLGFAINVSGMMHAKGWCPQLGDLQAT